MGMYASKHGNWTKWIHKDLKNRVKKNESIMKAQQSLIGGKRTDWKDVSVSENDSNANGKFVKLKDVINIDFMKFLPKPILVEPRQTGLTSTGIAGECHSNVRELVKRYGGQQITGFELSYVDDSSINPIHLNWHSIWKTPEGKFVDVTPLNCVKTDEVEYDEMPRPDNYYFVPMLSTRDNFSCAFGNNISCGQDAIFNTDDTDDFLFEVNPVRGKKIILGNVEYKAENKKWWADTGRETQFRGVA